MTWFMSYTSVRHRAKGKPEVVIGNTVVNRHPIEVVEQWNREDREKQDKNLQGRRVTVLNFWADIPGREELLGKETCVAVRE